jgi:hypothetical protein
MNYHLYNLAQLKQICREKKIKKYSRLKRFELIQLLEHTTHTTHMALDQFPKIISDIHYIFYPELTQRKIETRFTKKLRHNLEKLNLGFDHYVGNNIFELSNQKRIFIQTRHTPYKIDKIENVDCSLNSLNSLILNIDIHNAECKLSS